MDMVLIILIYICSSAASSEKKAVSLSLDKYKILPPIYKIENFISCIERNDLYCKVNIWLKNIGDSNNTLWILINESVNDKFSFDRNVIERGICIPKEALSSTESIKEYAELRANIELNGTDLIASVRDKVCTTKNVSISSYDKLFLFSLVAYISLTVYATLYDKWRKKCEKNETWLHTAVISFSLISNWRKVCDVKGNEDFNKLKSIQGIRFYNMLIIIALHTYLTFTQVYLSNPEDVEKLLSTTVMRYFITLSTVLVQPFFLISSWIVTFQIYNIYRDHGEFTAKQVLVLIINRFFRIEICSAVMILLLRSSWYKLLDGPINFENSAAIYQSCQQNWWRTFFFVNNNSYFLDMCHPPTWYLSVDFQLYILTVITIYLILKFKLNEWKVTSFLILISCILYGSIIYINEMDIILRIDVKLIRKYVFSRSDTLRILYTSTYSSWTTSLIGICLGIAYVKNKNRSVVHYKVLSVLWLIIFFGLPSAVVSIARHEFRGFTAAILGPLVKPLFSLGIGIGILGMSYNIGGIVKSVCENKYVVLMSNFTYSTYVFQTIVLFSKGVGSQSLMKFETTQLIKYFLFVDAPFSIILGIIGAVLFEQPGINLQKIFLPQIPRGRQHARKDQ